MNRTCRVGVHGRNDVDFQDVDYQVIADAKIETVKMMSYTQVHVFQRLKQLRPELEMITRLYDDRITRHGHPSPEDFAARLVPTMRRLQPYVTKFEVHNEPNHMDRVEGWGVTDADAQDFNDWFLRVYGILKSQCPWALLGFPGLAIPHRDLEWIELCRPAVQKADWLGVHCYWQTPPDELNNHLSDFWGLRFKYYHKKFPDKLINLTEVGNSNLQNGIPITEASLAREYVEFLTECFKHPYITSASFFILSSPDSNWADFSLCDPGGQVRDVVWSVRDMFRPLRAPVPMQPVRPLPAEPLPAPSSPPSMQPPPAPAPPPTRPPVPPEPVVTAPVIHNVIDQLPKNPSKPVDRRQLSQIRRIIIHHTAASASLSIGQIARYQITQRGHAVVTYHYFITADGTILQCNLLTSIINQSAARYNPSALGIGFAGNFTDMPPHPAQIKAGAWLIAWLLPQLNLPLAAVVGNKELIPTQSPGKQWDSGAVWGLQLRKQIQDHLTGVA